jgi:hypothetical protein
MPRVRGLHQIRAWVATQSITGLGTVSRDEKLRMIDVLMSGVVTDADMTAIRKLLSAVTTAQEMAFLRQAIEPHVRSLMDFAQRAVLRGALLRL